MSSKWWVWELINDFLGYLVWWWADRPRLVRCVECRKIYPFRKGKPERPWLCGPCQRAYLAREEDDE